MTKIISGTELAKKLRGEIKKEATVLREKGVEPTLAVVLVGDNKASRSYVNSKHKACIENNINSIKIELPEEISTDDLLTEIEKLNKDEKVHGILVQLPLPKHIDAEKVLNAVIPSKDVDGFHPINVGRLMLGLPCFVSATPLGILELLQRNNIPTKGKKCVIVGRSNIVGKPLATLMMQKGYGDATVTVCHSRTANLADECRQADILVGAMGRPEFITAEMVKEGAVVIDVGTTRVKDETRKSGFRLSGDVKYDEVAPKCEWITPVPGGVGPMTICMLMLNTLAAGKHTYYK